MAIAIVTGSAGLIGSETVKFLHQQGLQVVGIDNDMRSYFFGENASTAKNTLDQKKTFPHFEHHSVDIRDQDAIRKIFQRYSKQIELIVHTAAQPSHDWAAQEPFTDFSINATGTLNLLEAFRVHSPQATFIFTSTNKVYGDLPNRLPLVEQEMRWEIDSNHSFYANGIDESMSIDQSKHSLFGASKVAADVLVQEYGRYFGLKTGVFRGGCLTGPAHVGAQLHGFLAYLVECAVTEKPYTIFGYGGKQVRDNIHSYDLVQAFWHFFQNPKSGEVYNIGGSRYSNCSIREVIAMLEAMTGKKMNTILSEQARSGDHQWWISDVRKFKSHYPAWGFKYDLTMILQEIIEAIQERRS